MTYLNFAPKLKTGLSSSKKNGGNLPEFSSVADFLGQCCFLRPIIREKRLSFLMFFMSFKLRTKRQLNMGLKTT